MADLAAGMPAEGRVRIDGGDGRLVAHEVTAYIRARTPLPPVPDGRIRPHPAEAP